MEEYGLMSLVCGRAQVAAKWRKEKIASGGGESSDKNLEQPAV